MCKIVNIKREREWSNKIHEYFVLKTSNIRCILLCTMYMLYKFFGCSEFTGIHHWTNSVYRCDGMNNYLLYNFNMILIQKKIHSMRNRLFIFRLHDNFNWIYFTWRSVFYMYNVLYIYIRLCDSNQSLMLVYDHDDVACIYAETAWSICASINYILVLAETLYYIVPKKKPAKPFEKG